MDEKMEVFTIPIEVSLGKSLIITARLSQDQQDQLVHVAGTVGTICLDI